jgi:hypothetical protein
LRGAGGEGPARGRTAFGYYNAGCAWGLQRAFEVCLRCMVAPWIWVAGYGCFFERAANVCGFRWRLWRTMLAAAFFAIYHSALCAGGITGAAKRWLLVKKTAPAKTVGAACGRQQAEILARHRRGHRTEEVRIGLGLGQPADQQLHGLHRRQRAEHLAQYPHPAQLVGGQQ